MPRLAFKFHAGQPDKVLTKPELRAAMRDLKVSKNSFDFGWIEAIKQSGRIGMNNCAVDTAKTAYRSFVGQTFLHASNAAIWVLISFKIEHQSTAKSRRGFWSFPLSLGIFNNVLAERTGTGTTPTVSRRARCHRPARSCGHADGG
jgi:hypothetical protein